MDSFSQVITDALNAIQYTGPEDNERLRAAVQDLTPAGMIERNFFMRNADDYFLQICNGSKDCNADQIDTMKRLASDYLKNKYWMDEKKAQSVSEAVIMAFAVFNNAYSPADFDMELLSKVASGEVSDYSF